jgi:hypothetical protein
MEMMSKKNMGWSTLVETIRATNMISKNVFEIIPFYRNEKEKVEDNLLD